MEQKRTTPRNHLHFGRPSPAGGSGLEPTQNSAGTQSRKAQTGRCHTRLGTTRKEIFHPSRGGSSAKNCQSGWRCLAHEQKTHCAGKRPPRIVSRGPAKAHEIRNRAGCPVGEGNRCLSCHPARERGESVTRSLSRITGCRGIPRFDLAAMVNGALPRYGRRRRRILRRRHAVGKFAFAPGMGHAGSCGAP